MERIVRRGIDVAHREIVHPALTSGEASQDREIAHERALLWMERFQDNPLLLKFIGNVFAYKDPILKTNFAGLELPSPLGVAAGFDKNFRVHKFLGEGFGFGVITGGSVTLVPYDGNPRPRVFDLPFSNGLINRMGFPGEGVAKAVERLAKDKPHERQYRLVISIGASKPSFERDSAVVDYAAAYKLLLDFGDAFEINVSSPNTPGVRGLQEPEVFEQLMAMIDDVRKDAVSRKPVFIKLSPDLARPVREQVIKIAIDSGVNGLSLTNTSTSQWVRESLLVADIHCGEAGGVSGQPLKLLTLQVSHDVYHFIGGQIPIKKAGGIETALDLWQALTYGGATVAEVLTAFVRKDSSTPNFAYYLLYDLARALRKMGLSSINEIKDLRGRISPYPLSQNYRAYTRSISPNSRF